VEAPEGNDMTADTVTPEAPMRSAPAPAQLGRLVGWLLTAVAATGAVLTAALQVGRAIEPRPSGDLPYPGLGTEWALPVARVLHDGAAAATVGFLLLAIALLPDRRGLLTPTASAALVRARIAAGVWLVAQALEAVLNLSLSAAQPVPRILEVGLVQQYLTQVLEGQVALAGIIAAAVVVAAPPMRHVNSAVLLLMAAALGVLLPPLLTGHSASASGHDLAMTSLTVHVAAALTWVGGLAAVGWLAWTGREGMAVALPRYSRLAFGCFVAVMVSGVANAAIRLGRLPALWEDRYGLLVLGKVALLLALGAFGYRHRRRTVAAAAGGTTGGFLRLAAAELVVMAATFGLAVALSRSPTPVARSVPDVSPAKAALGYDLPPPVSVARLAFYWQPQLLFVLLVVVGVVLYARGAHRLRSRGDGWPIGRSAAWYGGLAVVVVSTQSGLSRYGGVLFSVHMAQHMLLAMVAPPLLALGAPATLALRVLPAAKTGSRSTRGWLLALLRSPVVRVLTNPLVALAIFVVSTFGLYFSGLFDALMREHAGHLLMELHFLATGCLLFWPIVSPDPLPHRPGHGARLLVLILTMPFHAFFGLAVLSSTSVLAGDWFGGLGRTWGASLLGDQRTGGGIAMALAEPIAVLVAGAVFVQWYRTDERTARALERRAERNPDTDDHAAYNRYLADLSKRP
jgi:cytochrome c oxidase assembly factor CtaG/putative copper export protein